jgi:rfaE bifunctional protein kinase chain/domain
MSKNGKKQSGMATVNAGGLANYVQQFPSKTIVLLGDFVADEFQYGEISRVSREAPVLILRHRETQLFPGGGANAANNLSALGARVFPVSVVGDDAAGESLMSYFRSRRVDASGIVQEKGWRTPTKTRFLAGWTHTVGQQVLRVDREPHTGPNEITRRKLREVLLSAIKNADALAISDYGFGIATPELAAAAAASLRKNVPVTLDARYHLDAYAKAGITASTPNEAEIEALHHTSIGANLKELERCGKATLSSMKLSSLLVTRGRHGMVLFEGEGTRTQIPVHGGDQAVDVTGAGDTVLAAYTLGLACDASALEAAHIANIAGGLVVMKRGTATVSADELLAAIRAAELGTSS